MTPDDIARKFYSRLSDQQRRLAQKIEDFLNTPALTADDQQRRARVIELLEVARTRRDRALR